MSRRFTREGHFVKNYLPHHRTGIRPIARDLLWEAVSWHYKHYMGDVALKSLRSAQQDVKLLQQFHSYIMSGETNSALTNPTKNFYFATFIPNNVPIVASTNPFCPYTQNPTGWQEVLKPRRPLPRPQRHHQVGGSDPRPPVVIDIERPQD